MREAGILLHITSLPGKYGTGDMGPEAYRFIDKLQQAGQSYWQILPVNPADPLMAYSPYTPLSAFAGNALFINPEVLLEDGFIDAIPKYRGARTGSRVNYIRAEDEKKTILENAFEHYVQTGKHADDYKKFCQQEKHWLHDWALFQTLYRTLKLPWHQWPSELRDRKPDALKKIALQFDFDIELEKFSQFIFYQQWNKLKAYCSTKDIKLLGDIPIYVGFNSADVWANPQFFKLTKSKKMAKIAGVPPDYFNDQGQLWDMPVYNWKQLDQDGYSWWLRRIAKNLELFDLVRLDHFRGFSAYWEVEGTAENAINGKWVKGPGTKLFDAIQKKFPTMPFIAEDLGDIDKGVYELRDKYHLPGMRVLQFAFEGDMPKSDFIPHNYTANSVAYTGTHDNNTVKGWYRKELSKYGKRNLWLYLGFRISSRKIHEVLIRELYKSVTGIAIVPMQDLIGLNSKHRMNTPATKTGNWTWRLKHKQFTNRIQNRLNEISRLYNRSE